MPDASTDQAQVWAEIVRTGGPFAAATVLFAAVFVVLWARVIKPMFDGNGVMVSEVAKATANAAAMASDIREAAHAARDAARSSEETARRLEVVIEVVKSDTRTFRIGPDGQVTFAKGMT